MISGTGGHGSLVTVQRVGILLVKESFVSGNSSQQPIVTTFNLTKDGFIKNNGSAELTIPEEAYQWANGTVSQRFFMKVQAHKWGNLVGWSLGHFNVIHKSQSSAKLLEAHKDNAAHSDRYPVDNFDNFRFGQRKKNYYAVKNEPVKRSASTSCTTTVTISAGIDGSLTDVIVCEIAFPVGLPTGEITVYTSPATCVDDTSSNPVPAPAPAPNPSPPTSSYSSGTYYFASEKSNDDNVPNTVSKSTSNNGISNVPTAAPAVVSISVASDDGNKPSMNVLLGSIIGAGVILVAFIVAIARWSGLVGGSSSKKEGTEDVTCATNASSLKSVAAAETQEANLMEESPDSDLTVLECSNDKEAVNNPMQN